jgi:heme-binding NEAT domain protein
MQVYDVNGKLVLSQTINGKTTIDASSLKEGVYNISIISNEGMANKRVVIVR